MRPSNKSRSRNKPGNNGNHNSQQRRSMGNIINRVFESAGPDGKVRGTPQQIIDKYQALARDAQLSGDRVMAESYLQHSEHYSRLLGEAHRQQAETQTRFNQEREDGPRGDDSQSRSDDNRQRGDDNRQQRNDDGYDNLRQQPMMVQPVASGLTTIEPDDSDDMSGPIETPEGRRARSEEPTPIVQAMSSPASEAVNGAGHAAADQENAPPAPAAKRPRTRRRAKAETEAPSPEPVSQTE